MIDEPLALLAEAFGQDVGLPSAADEKEQAAAALDGTVSVPPVALSPVGAPIALVL